MIEKCFHRQHHHHHLFCSQHVTFYVFFFLEQASQKLKVRCSSHRLINSLSLFSVCVIQYRTLTIFHEYIPAPLKNDNSPRDISYHMYNKRL